MNKYMYKVQTPYLDSVEHFLNVVSIFVQWLSRGGEEGDGLGALLHESHGRGWGETGRLKEIKDVATIKNNID